jgi:hypothetical protein
VRAVVVLLFSGMVIAIAAVAAQVPQPTVPSAQVPRAQVPTAPVPTSQVPQVAVPTLQAPQLGAPMTQPFAAIWSASGQRQTLATENGQAATTVQLSGAVTVTTSAGLSRGFRGEVIGFDDGAGLIQGRVVWTDDKSDHIFSVLTGGALAESGRQIHGRITGGTGRYEGITGEYDFHWQYLVTQDGSLISGRAADLRGQALPVRSAR